LVVTGIRLQSSSSSESSYVGVSRIGKTDVRCSLGVPCLIWKLDIPSFLVWILLDNSWILWRISLDFFFKSINVCDGDDDNDNNDKSTLNGLLLFTNFPKTSSLNTGVVIMAW